MVYIHLHIIYFEVDFSLIFQGILEIWQCSFMAILDIFMYIFKILFCTKVHKSVI